MIDLMLPVLALQENHLSRDRSGSARIHGGNGSPLAVAALLSP